MKDILNNNITVGDVVMWPGGSARYGGLEFIVGVVVALTAKRVSILSDKLVTEKQSISKTSKSSHKILVTTDPQVINSPTILAIKEYMEI